MILLIDNYDSFTFNLKHLFSKFDEVVVKRNDQITVDEALALDPRAIIISPGPGRPENAGICLPLIQAASKTVPILGVCLGHQAIAAAFGGHVIQSNDIVHGKTAQIFHDSSGLFKAAPLPFNATRYHSLTVDRLSLPSNFRVIAETQTGEVMAITHRSLPIFGVQFHPESFASEASESLAEAFISIVDAQDKGNRHAG